MKITAPVVLFVFFFTLFFFFSRLVINKDRTTQSRYEALCGETISVGDIRYIVIGASGSYVKLIPSTGGDSVWLSLEVAERLHTKSKGPE